MTPAALQAWSHVVGGSVPDEDLDLAACALLIAELERPGLDPATALGRLDELAIGARAGARSGESPLDATVRHLFVELGFRGNDRDYYDPRNSCLDQVLERRLGIPITLSLVLLEVGWRLGLEVAGVGFPGHFLVRARGRDGERMLDPFGGGVTVDREGLEDRLRMALGPQAILGEEHLRAVNKREILARMLHNLLGIYRRAGNRSRISEVGRLLEVLSPAAPPPGAAN